VDRATAKFMRLMNKSRSIVASFLTKVGEPALITPFISLMRQFMREK